MSVEPLQAALHLAEEYGLPVFPCRPDKKPYTEHGFKDATSSLTAIEEWWQRWPDALVGVPTGAASKVLVLDVDPAGFGWYQENAAQLAAGRVHRTRRAGYHLLYRAPANPVRNSASQLAPGIDVRGEGGYIIWWPAAGCEAVGDFDDIGDAPPWLLERLAQAPPIPAASATTPAGEGRVPEGGRNAYLSREAYRLRKQGMAVEQILIALRGLNAAMCRPPLEESELQVIAKGKERIEPEPSPAPPEDVAPQRPLLMDWADLDGKEPPARLWTIPFWVPAGHMTLLSGRGGVGKTLLAQHLGTALALGAEYIEQLEPKRVLMWAGEDDTAELWRRQCEISSWLGQPLSALAGRFYLHSYSGYDITLMAPIYGELAVTPMLAELKAQVRDYGAEAVILDNVARLFGGNENDRHQVTTFCALVQGACAPAAVILLGHPAKAAGSEYSGSTAWEGAVRARLYLGDRPPDQNPDDEDAPIADDVRYLSRRKANYSALDLRRLRMIGGVMVPDPVDPAKAFHPTGELAKDVVRRAVKTLGTRGIFGTGSTASPSYLPKLAKQYALLETLDPKLFATAMRQMILDGDLVSREVGKNANRTPKFGLVLP